MALLALGLLFCFGYDRAEAIPLDTAPHYLNEIERDLWIEHGLDRPSTHLRTQVERRLAGDTTILNVAVILVDFPDAPADRAAHPPEYYEDLLFSRGTRPSGSAADFLWESSFGRLDLRGTVRGWYTVDKTKNSYTAGAGGLWYYPSNSQRLAEEAVLLADPHINFADYDNDGPDEVPDSGDDDELIDGVVVVHAGSGREGGNISLDEFTSIKWRLHDSVPADGVFALDFTLNPEDGDIGLFLHELGHLMGLPDLYPTRSSIQGASFGLGAWSLMAGGLLLGEGRAPGDFDAWSKSQLGFVDVERIFLNQDDVLIPPTDRTGAVLRLWANGLGDREYFLLENRRRTGLDANLPGEGLLIYHVDESIPSNNNPDQYLVALEQADGLFQLENRFGDPSPGDAGDPFRAGDSFGRYSQPDSRAYDGTESHVAVFNIRGPDADGAYLADINVEPTALVTVLDIRMEELDGDGDGMIEAGETAGLFPRLRVDRFPALDLTVALSSGDARVELLDDRAEAGSIAADTVWEPAIPFRMVVAADLPSDPYGVAVSMRVDWRGDMGRTIPLSLGVGAAAGLTEDFESGADGWAHDRLRSSAKDQWFYTTGIGASGSAAFKCGNLGRGFLAGVDAALTSGAVLLPPDGELVFDHAVDIVTSDGSINSAGGVVEISVNGGDWLPVDPTGGYPALYTGASLLLRGRRTFAGTIDGGKFHEARFDLSEFTGWVRVRFRFFSDSSSLRGTAWTVDNVRIRSAVTPVRLVHRAAAVDGADVLLSWRLADPLPMLVRVLEGATRTAAREVGAGWMDAREDGSVRDPGAADRLPATYWIEGMERDGSVTAWGPWSVASVAVPPRIALLANPTRGSVTFLLSGSLRRDDEIEIFDLRGRRVAGLPAPAQADRVAWSGNDESGRAVAPGIYFARLSGADTPPVRMVRLP